MQQGIHPDYQEVTATCTCGATHKLNSTLKKDLHLDVCSQCHPFYTGKTKEIASGGRVDKFKKRFGALNKK